MIIGPIEQRTKIRFKNMDDFEKYINAFDFIYDSEDDTFTGYVYKLIRPQFKVFKRSAPAKSTNYMKDYVVYRGQNCIYQLPDCVLSNVLIISPKKNIQKNFQILFELNKEIQR